MIDLVSLEQQSPTGVEPTHINAVLARFESQEGAA